MSGRDWRKNEIHRRDTRKANFTHVSSAPSYDTSMTLALLSRMLEVSTPEGKEWLKAVYSDMLLQGENNEA
jgi:hypothetical protein